MGWLISAKKVHSLRRRRGRRGAVSCLGAFSFNLGREGGSSRGGGGGGGGGRGSHKMGDGRTKGAEKGGGERKGPNPRLLFPMLCERRLLRAALPSPLSSHGSERPSR